VAEESTNSIKREIERTRVEMSETIGEIQERLRPDHLLQQAKNGVKEAAAGKARSIMNSAGETAGAVAYRAKGVGENLACYAKEHPIRIAMTVGALTWFMLRGRDRSGDWYGAADTSWDESDEMSYDTATLRSRVGEYASSAKDTVGQYASSAKETVGQYASSARETVGEYAESARSGAVRASQSVRSAAGTATTSMDGWVRENPVAAGVIALAVGAAIGLSMPATELENRAMGETRDRAWERASKAAADLKENVTRKVEDAAENFVGDSLRGSNLGSTTEPMGRA